MEARTVRGVKSECFETMHIANNLASMAEGAELILGENAAEVLTTAQAISWFWGKQALFPSFFKTAEESWNISNEVVTSSNTQLEPKALTLPSTTTGIYLIDSLIEWVNRPTSAPTTAPTDSPTAPTGTPTATPTASPTTLAEHIAAEAEAAGDLHIHHAVGSLPLTQT